MQKAVTRAICFNKFLVVNQSLTASMKRCGSGFTPPTVLSELKDNLFELQEIVALMESISKSNPPDTSRFSVKTVGKYSNPLLEKKCPSLPPTLL
jgi:hypothetical protein